MVFNTKTGRAGAGCKVFSSKKHWGLSAGQAWASAGRQVQEAAWLKNGRSSSASQIIQQQPIGQHQHWLEGGGQPNNAPDASSFSILLNFPCAFLKLSLSIFETFLVHIWNFPCPYLKLLPHSSSLPQMLKTKLQHNAMEVVGEEWMQTNLVFD